jgi:hypothetical protein
MDGAALAHDIFREAEKPVLGSSIDIRLSWTGQLLAPLFVLPFILVLYPTRSMPIILRTTTTFAYIPMLHASLSKNRQNRTANAYAESKMQQPPKKKEYARVDNASRKRIERR